jgi:hypothetical protein
MELFHLFVICTKQTYVEQKGVQTNLNREFSNKIVSFDLEIFYYYFLN